MGGSAFVGDWRLWARSRSGVVDDEGLEDICIHGKTAQGIRYTLHRSMNQPGNYHTRTEKSQPYNPPPVPLRRTSATTTTPLHRIIIPHFLYTGPVLTIPRSGVVPRGTRIRRLLCSVRFAVQILGYRMDPRTETTPT
jgi:hypothetical protein